ncbi:sensor histidine kinase [Oscillochloris sp. ZM17-4]|uniref:sensor histidine kinase n=1 Tax=Oscillochloris sp. ZM17-4 TaxID=2866714 RepID=UPI001C72E785|nr:sensor histidine kinase [Oscillochloris sp. ZM17-4]MBX0330232.1 sensor histidine kinase [Oscillochloris sp. ZM17-4]
MSQHKQRDTIQILRGLRWPLAGAVGLVFALVRLVETLIIGASEAAPAGRMIDSVVWGGLAGAAVWAVLSWAARQERRRRSAEAAMLAELRSSNARLAQLYELNQRIASSATLDDVLDYAITLPASLLGARAAALVLRDEGGQPLDARRVGVSAEELQSARATFGLLPSPPDLGGPRAVLDPNAAPGGLLAAAVLPLAEGDDDPVGWIEAYLSDPASYDGRVLDGRLPAESEALLITVAGELAEAVQGSRRRAREIASVAALEQAIMAERTRIARDLHDGVAQSLAFMRMRVDLWEDWVGQDPARLREEFAAMKVNLRQQIEELRRAIFALRPFELGQLGFGGALRRFVREFAGQQGWEIDLDLADLPADLPLALELAAFRFVQEGLNNAAKHAQAGAVAVGLRQIDGGLQIVVRDDGAGFNPGDVAEGPGGRLGLRQMRERAAALDGRVTVISRPGAGAELRVWLPLAYAKEMI